jgi:membrane glycosyltransferase
MSYVASPLWLLQLFIGLALALQARFIRPEYFTHEFDVFPAWPIFDSEKALYLFIFTMFVLLTPKILGLIASLYDGKTRKASGGAFKLILSAILEVIVTALLAPVMMVIQSSSVFSIIFGRDTGWNPQSRDDGTIPLKDIIRRHYRHVLLGVAGTISALAISPYIFAWMSPTLIGLLLAVPLSYYSASAPIGKFLKRHKLLLIPEESNPPAIAEQAFKNGEAFRLLDLEGATALQMVHENPEFSALHNEIIQSLPPRKKGEIDVDKAVAEAKLMDASNIAEASKWLTKKEVILTLHDRSLVSVVARLDK